MEMNLMTTLCSAFSSCESASNLKYPKLFSAINFAKIEADEDSEKEEDSGT
jgi:hypothetical protein